VWYLYTAKLAKPHFEENPHQSISVMTVVSASKIRTRARISKDRQTIVNRISNHNVRVIG